MYQLCDVKNNHVRVLCIKEKNSNKLQKQRPSRPAKNCIFQFFFTETTFIMPVTQEKDYYKKVRTEKNITIFLTEKIITIFRTEKMHIRFKYLGYSN